MKRKREMTQGSSSCSVRKWKRDVFVSFRGEDIRNTFANHLFGALRREGIRYVFRDDGDIKPGDHIATELTEAIEGSQVLIPVFSKNYANSSWCLRELAQIVDCTKVTGQHVLPVFYDVSPSEVRKQSGEYFGKAFEEHEQRFRHDLEMVQRWRQALVQVADLSGSDIGNKLQYEEIEKIVKRVKSLLDHKLSGLDGLVGMDSRVEQLENLLATDSNDDVRVIGICGMGGIGKTTLARQVYCRTSHQYGASCFIDDVSKVYQNGGLIAVQKQLICQTHGEEETRDIWNIPKATHLIKTGLCHRKAIVVLDNVDKVEQLEKLGVYRECLRAGSRVIVVSRDRHILNTFGVDEVYDAQLLDHDEAYQLFCRKAFKNGHIMSCDEDINREYEAMIDLALIYAQGLPLAIEVLGSFLNGRKTKEWKSALERLRDNPERGIMDVLQISFDALAPMEKEIFLDIACFIDQRPTVWKLKEILDYCGFHPDIGILVLVDKSLITLKQYGWIHMHDKLQELGKNIVRKNAPKEPRKWSRIWREEDFQSLMFEKMPMDDIEAMVLYSDRNSTKTSLRAEAVSRMNRLRVLSFVGVNFSGSIHCLSKELRYIEWGQYPFTYFPSGCELINLVELRLCDSSVTQLWEGKKPLYKLRLMDLSRSKNLVRTPDLSRAPNLEQLMLRGCTNLEHIHPSIGDLKKLFELILTDCTSLKSVPNSIYGATSLKEVYLEGCSKAFQSQLSENTSYTGIQLLQSASSLFKRLKHIMLPSALVDSTRCNDNFGPQMSFLACFYCLESLNLSYCGLVNIPESLASLSCLKKLYLYGNNIVELPSFITMLPRLVELKLDNCKQLSSVSLCVSPLRPALQLKHSGRVVLGLFDCPKLVEMESLSSMALSWMIQFLKVHKEPSPPRIIVVIPGTQIPSWFNHQSEGTNMVITVDVHDSNWIGIAFCTNIFASHLWYATSISIVMCYQDKQKLRELAYVINHVNARNEVTKTNHLGLFYYSRQRLEDILKLEKANMDEDVLKFRLEYYNSTDNSFRVEKSKYGARVVLKQDLEEEFVSDGQ